VFFIDRPATYFYEMPPMHMLIGCLIAWARWPVTVTISCAAVVSIGRISFRAVMNPCWC
jgi:hypothetical protein